MIVLDGVEMVDVREAARLAGRSPETVRRWVWSGRLPSVKNGNKWFVPRSQVAGRGQDTGSGSPRSLRAWAESLPQDTRETGRTASDLVLEDRAERAGR
jgi:excisionase family DNA binding protein